MFAFSRFAVKALRRLFVMISDFELSLIILQFSSLDDMLVNSLKTEFYQRERPVIIC